MISLPLEKMQQAGNNRTVENLSIEIRVYWHPVFNPSGSTLNNTQLKLLRIIVQFLIRSSRMSIMDVLKCLATEDQQKI